MSHDSRMQKNSNWKGGIRRDPLGRMMIRQNNGKYKYRYRILMELILGRELKDEEIVHHINGDVSDDRIENLQLLSQSKHASIHGFNASYESRRKRARYGPQNPFFGKHHTVEAKAKIKEAAKHRKPPRLGAIVTEETRYKQSLSMKRYYQNLKEHKGV